MIDAAVAEIVLVGQSGVFVAEEYTAGAEHVWARGRHRRRYGPRDAPTYSWGPLVERSWPWRRVHEVRRSLEHDA